MGARHRKSVIASRWSSFFSQLRDRAARRAPSSCRADEGFISLRLNTPVGSSLEYTDSKVQQVEAALKSFPRSR
jgi:HAE1 family hydrophobic/amphiphilic exporter-1